MRNLVFKYKIWLETAEHHGVLGDGKCRLLKTIHETGSLKESMRILGLSYRKTWDNLKRIEKVLGFQIIERQRGGKEGGQTKLTPQGKAIVQAFDEFHTKYDSIILQGLQDAAQEIINKL